MIAFILTGCGKEGTEYTLPDINGYTLSEIEELFDSNDWTYSVVFEDAEDEDLENLFSRYVNYNTGDTVNSKDEVVIKVYPTFSGTRTKIVLPDLTGYTDLQIDDYFSDLGMTVNFSEWPELDVDKQGEFYSYAYGYEVGDEFLLTNTLTVIVYRYEDDMSMYYFSTEMEYDGPYLDESFSSIDYLDPRGGYFEVTLNYCGDGDTAVFHYPQDVYDAITSGAKSVRFLNMDTEETYSGGEEEWGKPGSVYTCGLLEEAEEIILQTDPGDNLLGNYGRLLAWVWIKLPGEDEFFLLNYMVVKQGLAQVKYEFGAGTTISYGDHTYNEWMHIAEDYAKNNNLGQWGSLLDYYWDYDNDQPDFTRWYND